MGLFELKSYRPGINGSMRGSSVFVRKFHRVGVVWEKDAGSGYVYGMRKKCLMFFILK